ncbi:MAG: hypothetical protein ABSH44_19065 [Bryobacteraceae bacterium]|jgi:hypothetical protein
MKKAAVTFASLFLLAALATANAKTYSVTLSGPSVVSGTQLKAGTYNIDVGDSSIVIKGGKTPITVPAKLENVDTKYPATSVRYRVTDGKYEIQEIRLGDTKLKLVLGAGESNAATTSGQTVR